LSWNLHIESTNIQNFITVVQVLNATDIASAYTSRDPQGGTSDESFLQVLF